MKLLYPVLNHVAQEWGRPPRTWAGTFVSDADAVESGQGLARCSIMKSLAV